MKYLLAVAGAFALAFFVTPAAASADPLSEALDSIFGSQTASLHPYYIGYRGRRYRNYYRRSEFAPVANEGVSSMIASRVSAVIGSEWVSTALRIARIESGGRCGVVNGIGATGVFQVMHPERFGISRASARTCSGGIAAGVAHMRACIAKGAHTSAQMMVCHNTGSPFSRRVERAYRRFL
mgnify:CR=1 FL=1